jgi:hypothetical protein
VAIAIAREPGMPDAHEAGRQHMEKVASQEFRAVEREDLESIVIGVVAVPKADGAVEEIHQPVLADLAWEAGGGLVEPFLRRRVEEWDSQRGLFVGGRYNGQAVRPP